MGRMVVETTIERVRLLTLNRPEARNALSAEMRRKLIRAIATAEADPDIGAIVVTGEGKCFAAGADLVEMARRTAEEQEEFLHPPHIYSIIEEAHKPVIAALNGHALGAGLELATACDLRIAAPKAKLGQPEINLGLIPGGGGTQRLVRLIGHGQASRLVLTGQLIDGNEALSLGLVEEVSDDPVRRAIELGNIIGGKPETAVTAAKLALGAARDQDYHTGLEIEIARFMDCHQSDDAKRLIKEFLEK